ncbi:alpha-L-arabinofuranosidase C-terminal domain-containing protein [Actinacidiphila soli]|uniref:alpha-L-arabinofuranosidase C-terminal domain-containing protein n=1 Tax=Actinacidiphila soli TaxID=2487275 RepID=UPI000FCA027E|nr:alpha-L-arabinofuranosidase C-terminal domain-containing protein [Actinacidiphila soli]
MANSGTNPSTKGMVGRRAVIAALGAVPLVEGLRIGTGRPALCGRGQRRQRRPHRRREDERRVEGRAKAVITGPGVKATNTLADPTAVVPVTTALTGLGTSFSYTFPPYSVTLLEVNAS